MDANDGGDSRQDGNGLDDRPLISFVLTSWHDGGVERLALRLLQELEGRGEFRTELVLLSMKPKASNPMALLAQLPPSTGLYVSRVRGNLGSAPPRQELVKIRIPLKGIVVEGLKSFSKGKIPRHVRDVPALTEHFSRNRPKAVLAMGHRANIAAVQASLRSKLDAAVVCSVHSSLDYYAGRELDEARRHYPGSRKVVAVSQGIADQLEKRLALPDHHVEVIGNPIPSQLEMADQNAPAPHEWYMKREVPVIASVGRLSPEKDIPTLLKALKELQEPRKTRLVIVGRGDAGYTQQLKEAANALSLGEVVYFAGFQENPLSWIAHADLLALSSISEGFGMVLVEAMMVGTPVVSTDAPPGGPAEILSGGDCGKLVEPGNPKALALAIKETLENPPTSRDLLARAQHYLPDRIANAYLSCAGL